MLVPVGLLFHVLIAQVLQEALQLKGKDLAQLQQVKEVVVQHQHLDLLQLKQRDREMRMHKEMDQLHPMVTIHRHQLQVKQVHQQKVMEVQLLKEADKPQQEVDDST